MADNRTIPVNAQGAVVTFTLKINEEQIPQTVQVLRLSVQKEINKISLAKVIVLDGDAASEDFPVSNEELFIPGNTLEIFAGHQSEEDLIFKGEIVKHGIQIRQNGTTLLKVEARDIAYKLTLTYKNRYFQEQTDSEVIEDILGEYEIEHKLTDTSVTHPELIQYETCDWDFILSRADVNGRFCLVDDGIFNMIQPDFDQESNLTLQFGATILEFDAEIDSRMQYKMVKTQSWDASTQELIEAEATEPSIEEQGNLSSTSLAEANSLEEFILHHNGSLQEDELQSWADAKLQKSRLAKIRGRVRLEGYAGAKPGNILTLSGVGDRFNGKVFVSGVRHYLAEGEWGTDFQFGVEPRWFAADRPVHAPLNSGLAPGIQGLHIGVVKQIHDDPTGAFRVLVNIPLIDPDEEGSWCRVASLDAGENRGFFFRPDVGDEVILGFLNNNPKDGVILGLLHSAAKTSPIEATEENAEKGYVSGSEMKLLFNDEDVSVNLETPKGNTISLSESNGGIKLEDENGNKILMDSSGILIESASDLILKATGDVKTEGTNIENKANANFKADGSAGGELTSGAIVKVQGSLVQIN